MLLHSYEGLMMAVVLILLEHHQEQVIVRLGLGVVGLN